jgi:hypothetical protein
MNAVLPLRRLAIEMRCIQGEGKNWVYYEKRISLSPLISVGTEIE